MSTVSSGNIMNYTGLHLSNFMIDGYKYNIIAVSKPYNTIGAYYRLENDYIQKNDKMYNLLSDYKETISNSFVEYYNKHISCTVKNMFGTPISISVNDIDSISVTRLDNNYTEYWNR